VKRFNEEQIETIRAIVREEIAEAARPKPLSERQMHFFRKLRKEALEREISLLDKLPRPRLSDYFGDSTKSDSIFNGVKKPLEERLLREADFAKLGTLKHFREVNKPASERAFRDSLEAITPLCKTAKSRKERSRYDGD
jgi:hypothetical protein